ncbi:hypothetical protein Bpfe_018941 [Biomphalaria pfeifferi]|uniref:Uncharacterized protein n=1 Tax=Biomphalaria pfeifferi TaxID=112525 RepID=A0AAD8BBE8_BIOPF|nr:hypothetical protein Bpfe_018941 [Biomphalaria pfeifferi]
MIVSRKQTHRTVRGPALAKSKKQRAVSSFNPGRQVRTVLAATPPSPSMVLRGESGKPLLTTVSMRLDQCLVQSVGQFCMLCGPKFTLRSGQFGAGHLGW